MGTEVQSKMYLQGYYSLRDLNNNAGKGSWPLHHEQKTLRSGQYHEIFLTRSEMDGYDGHDKELLRQTILKHETIFRQQLCELHRLYKIQRDLMNDIKSEPHKHLIPAGTSQSISFPAGFLSEDEKKRWHISTLSLDSSYGRPSTAGVDCSPSHFNSEKGKIMQIKCCSTQNGARQKDYESLEPKCGKLPRRLFDLEIPAHEYIDNEGEEQKVSGDLGVQSYPPNGSLAHKRDGNLSICTGVSTCCSADTFSSNVHLRKAPGLTDLNEKIQVEEAYASDILANNMCFKEKVQRQDSSASAYSGFRCLAKEFSQNLHNGRGGAVSNLCFENESKQQDQLSYTFEAGKTRSNGSSFCGIFRPEDFPKPCESSQVETMKARDTATCFPSDQSKTEQQIKRTIFGVEISDTNQDSSVVASHSLGLQTSLVPKSDVASHSLGLQTSLVPKSDVANSKSFIISPWTKPPGSLSQHITSTQGNPCCNTSPQSSKSSVTLTRSPQVTGELLIDSYSKSIPDTRAEVSYRNDVYLRSQSASNELHGCQPSGHLGFPNGINDCNFTFEQFQQHEPQKYLWGSDSIRDVKSAKKMNMNAVASNDQYKVICEQNLVSVDWPRTQENSQGASSWLRPMSNFNGKYSREKEGSGHNNLGSWQNYSLQFVNNTEIRNGPSQRFTQDSSSATCADDAEHGKIDKGNCSSNMKILGFPIIDRPHILKDLPSHSSPSKHSCLASAIDTVNAGLVITDLAHDPMSPRSGEVLKEKDQVIAKGLDNHGAPSRHQIDLNICVTEEEVLSTPSSPIATQIDLEVPVVIDSEGYPESRSGEPFASLQDESRVPCEGLIGVAAEALVSISSSHVHNLPSHAVDNPQENATCHQSEASLTDSLHWLAEIISSCKADTENKVVEVSMGEDNSFQEELIPDGIDFFEFMTLNLTESKVEDYCYKPQTSENQIDENTLQRKTRRRQTRRGRQRKDFQRDVLRSITSLSRNEVTEDLQTIEGLIKATGGTWQSGLAHKNSRKSGGGRGRRRSAASNSPSIATAVCLPQVQQPKCIVLGLEERSLTGWGKRTRRPTRQRCLINNPPLCLK